MKPLCKTCLLLVAVIVACSQGVWAEDALTCDWTGSYIGAHLGGGFSSTHMTLEDSWSLHPDSSGVVGGGQIGYNLQRGKFVLGLEADLSGSGMDGSDGSAVLPPPIMGGVTVRSHEDVNWFGTLRPRLGYTPISRLLIYATGGLAFGNVSYSWDKMTGSYPVYESGTSSGMHAGWTVGGGVEYALSKNWSMNAEYLFCNLGDEGVTGIPRYLAPPPIPKLASSLSSFSTEFSVFDIGLNYRF